MTKLYWKCILSRKAILYDHRNSRFNHKLSFQYIVHVWPKLIWLWEIRFRYKPQVTHKNYIKTPYEQSRALNIGLLYIVAVSTPFSASNVCTEREIHTHSLSHSLSHRPWQWKLFLRTFPRPLRPWLWWWTTSGTWQETSQPMSTGTLSELYWPLSTQAQVWCECVM